MKTQGRNSNENSASVLLATLGVCAVLGILAVSNLVMVQSQHFSVVRAQAWNAALVVAEAGVEEAMANLNNTNIMIVGLFSGGNKWVNLGGGAIAKANIYLADSNYYNVIIYTQSNSVAPLADPKHPVIVSSGYVPGPISSPKLSRTVRVQAEPITAIVPDGAMVATTTVDFAGMNVTTDSFQSTNTDLFPNGKYNVANRRDHGDVTTLSTNSGDLTIQNAKVRGTVHTPPNWKATDDNVGSGGSVGDNDWVGGNHQDLQPGHAKADAIQVYPDATLPTESRPWLPAPAPSTFIKNGVTYVGYILLTTNSPWIINNLNAGIYVNGPNVRVQLKGASASVPSGKTIHIPNLTDASGRPYGLEMYVSAPSFNVVGTGVANDGGVARNLQYYGLPSNTQIKLGGNGSVTAQIYAPQADFTLGGGGSDTYDYAGMCVVKSVKMNGHFNFHFDECSKSTLNLFGFTASSWEEL